MRTTESCPAVAVRFNISNEKSLQGDWKLDCHYPRMLQDSYILPYGLRGIVLKQGV